MLLTCQDAALHQDARSQLFMLYTSAADEACLQAYVLQLVRYLDWRFRVRPPSGI